MRSRAMLSKYIAAYCTSVAIVSLTAGCGGSEHSTVAGGLKNTRRTGDIVSAVHTDRNVYPRGEVVPAFYSISNVGSREVTYAAASSGYWGVKVIRGDVTIA